jgi:nucleotide-binding universal stress UspA family protein
MMYTILVPLDGSPLAEQALPYAERLTEALSARLILSRVLPLSVLQPAEADLASADEARAYVLRVGDRLTTNGRLVEMTTPWGEPAAEILEQARSAQADLVVMATHGRSGPGRWLYGSVADEVLRHASVPVILVPRDSAAPWSADRSPRILVPLDGSELGEAALGPAQKLAARLRAEIVLLQVIPFPPYELYPGAVAAYLEAFDPDAQVVQANQYLAQTAQRLRPTISQVRIRAELGKPAALIAQVAVAEQADLIVMATHGRTGVARLVLGSIATATLQHASIPLMFVRPTSLKSSTASVAPEVELTPEPAPAG